MAAALETTDSPAMGDGPTLDEVEAAPMRSTGVSPSKGGHDHLKASHGAIEGITGGAALTGKTEAKARRTVHAQRTMVRNGQLVSVPFKTSAKPFKAAVGEHSTAYGNHSSILNPPNKERTKSVSASSYDALPVMTAGTTHKKSVPYHPNASRNRLKQQPKRMPPPHESTLKLSSGVAAVSHLSHPYMTTSKFAQRETGKPIHTRVGFTNQGIMSEFTRLAHKGSTEV
jgi:hypothetical protein